MLIISLGVGLVCQRLVLCLNLTPLVTRSFLPPSAVAVNCVSLEAVSGQAVKGPLPHPPTPSCNPIAAHSLTPLYACQSPPTPHTHQNLFCPPPPATPATHTQLSESTVSAAKSAVKAATALWGGQALPLLEAEDRLSVACEKGDTQDEVLLQLRQAYQVPGLRVVEYV